ncbi:hypothetical protein [Glaciimonas immobilis]|uniref:Uncharacterized protein n=1 Tax=Glaciimonas immobilis TaxID=728004 RepID=A0A840RXC4_9BURK|nr:hypothetical protein [Glaciimonas immobilis]KAF3996025.1 hypothetical protein HAV38_19905 [Glaciimonas immobilis]MBB5201852.1 hypothetical protein [Glaciimonas immobilis]
MPNAEQRYAAAAEINGRGGPGLQDGGNYYDAQCMMEVKLGNRVSMLILGNLIIPNEYSSRSGFSGSQGDNNVKAAASDDDHARDV